jgi:hypothetical protein
MGCVRMEIGIAWRGRMQREEKLVERERTTVAMEIGASKKLESKCDLGWTQCMDGNYQPPPFWPLVIILF